VSVGRAPGKVILLGEHFVVYGVPAVAVPVSSRFVEVEARVRAEGAPGQDGLPAEWDVAPEGQRWLRELLGALGEAPERWWLRVHTTLPLGCGLGGSAALAVALVRALGCEDPEEVRRRAHALERLAHGNPSGIDDAVAASGRAVRYVRGEPPQVLDDAADVPLWVGLTPSGPSTREAVEGVAARREADRAWFGALEVRAREVVERGLGALRAGDLVGVGEAMTHNHELLRSIGVSTPRLDALVDAALAAGAWGAKLTGSGLGGAMVALAPADAPMDEVLRRAGATDVLAPG